MSIKIKNVIICDSSKASPEMKHKYIPTKVDYSPFGEEYRDIKDEDRPYCICRYMSQSEFSKVYNINTSGIGTVLKEVFLGQVEEIHGLTVSDGVDITPKQMCESQANPVFTAFIAEVGDHLLSASTLTEREQKN